MSDKVRFNIIEEKKKNQNHKMGLFIGIFKKQ